MIPFQQNFLLVTDIVTVPATIDRLLQLFAADENTDLVVPFIDTAVATKQITTRSSMYLPFV